MSPSTPLWSRRAVAGLALLYVAGAGAIGVSWAGASDRSDMADQVPWLNVATMGLFVMCAASVGVVLSGRRSIGRRLTGLPRPAQLVEVVVETDAMLVSGDRMRLFHRPDCQLVAGKTTTPLDRDAHMAAGRRPCGVCAP